MTKINLIKLKDFQDLSMTKLVKGDSGYFVFGNEANPYHKFMTVTEISGNFIEAEEKYPIKAHIETTDLYKDTGSGVMLIYGNESRTIVDEWETNILTLNSAKWHLDFGHTLKEDRSDSSKNLIFKNKLDAGAYVAWLRESYNDNDE